MLSPNQPNPTKAASHDDDDIVIITKPMSSTVHEVLTAAGFRVVATTAHHTVYSLAPESRGDAAAQQDVVKPPSADRAALTVADAAHLLGISTSHAYHLVQTGSVPAVRLGRRVLIPRHALDDLLR